MENKDLERKIFDIIFQNIEYSCDEDVRGIDYDSVGECTSIIMKLLIDNKLLNETKND